MPVAQAESAVVTRRLSPVAPAVRPAQVTTTPDSRAQLGPGGNGRDPGTTSSPGGGGGGGYYGGGGGGGGGRDAFGNVAGGGGGGAGSSFVEAQATGTSIVTDSTGAPQVVITFTPGTPAASPSPSGLTFGSQPQTTLSSPQTVTITNTGTAPLTISGLTFGGADPSDFLDGSDNCRGSVADGASCHAAIYFAPQGAGGRSATLIVSSNDPSSPQTISLTGTGGSLPTGPSGSNGTNGTNGTTGANGTTGPTGAIGPQGPPGPEAVYICRRRRGNGFFPIACFVQIIGSRGEHVSATISRDGIIYASGHMTLTAAHGSFAPRSSRALRRGRYVLTVTITRGKQHTVIHRLVVLG